MYHARFTDLSPSDFTPSPQSQEELTAARPEQELPFIPILAVFLTLLYREMLGTNLSARISAIAPSAACAPPPPSAAWSTAVCTLKAGRNRRTDNEEQTDHPRNGGATQVIVVWYD